MRDWSSDVCSSDLQDIANAVLFFASDESCYITGDSVNVMGGRYIF